MMPQVRASSQSQTNSPPKTRPREKKASKTKFTCPECGQNAWAKPDALLICGECYNDEGGISASCALSGSRKAHKRCTLVYLSGTIRRGTPSIEAYWTARKKRSGSKRKERNGRST
jgi:hypothetical protein